MRLADYLKRTGYTGPVTPELAVLAGMLRAHVTHVPFENLDVQLGRRLTIDPEAAFEKIVAKRRGGWCYEQNGLLGWALAEAGFDVTRIAAAVMRNDRGEISTANHLCLLVRTEDSDRRWLADVGFGGSMIRPIPLAVGHHRQAPFRIGLRKTADGYWQFYEDLGDGEFRFDFLAEPGDEAALAARCRFLQTDPSSGFVQNLVAQIRLPDAHKTLRGKVFSQASARGVATHFVETPDELLSILRDIFTLDVPEVADLWPRIEQRHEIFMREKAITDTYEIRSRSRFAPRD